MVFLKLLWSNDYCICIIFIYLKVCGGVLLAILNLTDCISNNPYNGFYFQHSKSNFQLRTLGYICIRILYKVYYYM